jgi:multiple antibiotic resistance protein
VIIIATVTDSGRFPATRRRIMLRESIIALAILEAAVFAGHTVMNALGLQTASLGIAGGIVLLLAQKQERILVSLAVLIACTLSSVILALSPRIHALPGTRSSRALERLMGMLLIMMSVQMILDGLLVFLKQ